MASEVEPTDRMIDSEQIAKTATQNLEVNENFGIYS
jgi:hypothetical protein